MGRMRSPRARSRRGCLTVAEVCGQRPNIVRTQRHVTAVTGSCSAMDEPNGTMESMITSAVFLLKKYVRTKRAKITEALREEERAVIEPSQSLVVTLKEAQTLVNHLEDSVKSLDVSFKMIDKKIRDKLTMAAVQQNMLRCRRNKEITVSQISGNHLIPHHSHVVRDESSTQMSQLSVTPSVHVLPSADRSPGGRQVPVMSGAGDEPAAPDYRCPFCRSRQYTGKPPLLRHISDVHPERYQVFVYIYKLTPEAMLSSGELLVVVFQKPDLTVCLFQMRSVAAVSVTTARSEKDPKPPFYAIFRKIMWINMSTLFKLRDLKA